jgi:phage tail sheath protein FI
MPSLKRPGVYAEEILLNPQQSLGGTGVTINGAFVGANNRGPLVPTFISTWSEYVSLFGPFSNPSTGTPINYWLPQALFQYFANGGQGVYVTRVTGANSGTATRSLGDRAGNVPTLSLSALNPGFWGNSIYIDVTDYGATGSQRFSITVHFGDATANTVVEKWTDLSMVVSDPRYAPNVINAGNGAGSKYVVAVDLFSSNAPAQALPALQAGVVLAGGLDGSTAGATEYLAAVNTLDQVVDPVVLNLPGVFDPTTLTNTINYATNRGDVFVVADTSAGLTSSGAITAAAGLPTSAYAAVYYPWIQVNDPSTSTPGVTKMIPPGGAVVGQIMRTDAARGVFKAPAGVGTRIAGAVGLELRLTNTDLDALNTSIPPVNAIRNVIGVGPCIMGARTLDPSTNNVYIPNRRTIIYLKSEIKNLMTPALFEPNDENLWGRITSDINNFLMGFWQIGGLKGGTPQAAYYIKCDSTVNTPSVIASGQVIAEVGVSTQTPAEYVVLRIGQTNGGASVADNS